MAGNEARPKERKGLVPAQKQMESAFPKHFGSFELRLTPDKGIGAFATRAMEAGTSFFEEFPIMVFTKRVVFINEVDVARDYDRLSVPEKIIFDEARHDPTHAPHCKCKKGTASANSFGDPPHIYPVGSRFNHSCNPNMIMLKALPGRVICQTFRTVRSVAIGEELCFNYSSCTLTFLTTEERREELSNGIHHFKCLCPFCQRSPKERLVSDMRRNLLRHLEFWLRIQGTMKEIFMSEAVRKTVVNPKLKRSGVYTLLYAMLQEAEGIVIGGDAYAAYAYTALHVLNVAYHNRILRISPRVVQEMRSWMRKAEANVMLQYGDPSEGEELQGIREAMSTTCVPDNGELHWPSLLKVSANRMRTGTRLFSSVPP